MPITANNFKKYTKPFASQNNHLHVAFLHHVVGDLLLLANVLNVLANDTGPLGFPLVVGVAVLVVRISFEVNGIVELTL